MKLVAFTGKKYSGKDTAAKALVADDPRWQALAFADPLREMLYTLNPAVRVGNPGGEITRWKEAWDTVGYDSMKTWPEVRRLMQVFGTEVMREQFGADVWVDLTMKKIDNADTMHWHAVTDLRFDNEARAVRARGGHVIEVLWTGPNTRDQHGAEHSSEDGISRGLIDAQVRNDGTDDYLVRVREVVATLTR